jgi:hypothetical protein
MFPAQSVDPILILALKKSGPESRFLIPGYRTSSVCPSVVSSGKESSLFSHRYIRNISFIKAGFSEQS